MPDTYSHLTHSRLFGAFNPLCAYCRERPAGYVLSDTLTALCRGCFAAADVHRCHVCDGFFENALPCDTHCSDCCEAETDYDDYDDEYGDSDMSCNGLVYDYSYKPDPDFHGDGPVHLGMELEVEVRRSAYTETARCAVQHLGSLGYLKEDGSIRCGFEIVTHPMSHAYAGENFPWEMLTELAALGAEGGDEVGIHVHVSRAGFSGPAHAYRWLKFLYRNAAAVQSIARRQESQWASFEHYDRVNIKHYVKRTMYGRRYAAVNVCNSNTFEVRVFASTLERREVQAALDLVAGSVEYTRHLTVREILNGGWTWDNFIEWAGAKEQGDTYNALIAESDACV